MRLSLGSARHRAALVAALVAALAALLVGACDTAPRRDVLERDTPRPGTAAPAPAARAERPRLVVLGDSLSSGYGLPGKEQSFPARLQAKVDEAGLAYEVVNMGVAGDTSAGGLRRLDWALDGDVRVLVLALGGNDGLRGLSAAQLRENLAAIIDRAQSRGVRVLLCGMEAPPNLGSQYTTQFRTVYRDLAREKGVAFLPFLLDGIAGDPALNQPDGIHPNEAGTARMTELVWASLRPLLAASS